MSYISRRPRIAKPRADFWDWYEDEAPQQTSVTVHEDESGPVWTGLYDAAGNELCRIPDRVPMGFRLK